MDNNSTAMTAIGVKQHILNTAIQVYGRIGGECTFTSSLDILHTYPPNSSNTSYTLSNISGIGSSSNDIGLKRKEQQRYILKIPSKQAIKLSTILSLCQSINLGGDDNNNIGEMRVLARAGCVGALSFVK